MPINLHLTPTVPCKHPSIAGAFPHFGTGVCAASFISNARSSAATQARNAEIQVLAGTEIRTVIQY